MLVFRKGSAQALSYQAEIGGGLPVFAGETMAWSPWPNAAPVRIRASDCMDNYQTGTSI